MNRKEFISRSALSFGGLALLPVLNMPHIPEKGKSIILEVNSHIRHGYYGNEYLANSFNNPIFKNLRIDVFDNPEGKMTLLDIEYKNEKLLLSLYDDELIVNAEQEIREFSIHQNTEVDVFPGIRFKDNTLSIQGLEYEYRIIVEPRESKFTLKVV